MYLALIGTPDIGMHKWTCWSYSTFAIVAQNDEEALEIIKQICGKKDPEIQQALIDQDGYKGTEYFDIILYQIPKGRDAVYIPEPSRGFPKPNIRMRI
ncbi:MAG: hypothetical protein ACYC4I_01705 [Minisyncoccota bacterium]